ncbi:MAG: NCS2 family permease [Puniceicoccaceae bacterium]
MKGLRIGRGDWNGFVAAAVNNLVQLLILIPLCLGPLDFSLELVFGRILPGVAISFLVGNLYYAWLAKRQMRLTGREDICALPYGISTPAIFAHIFLIMLPAKSMAEAQDLPNPERIAWQAGLMACFLGGLIEMAGAFVAARLRRWVPRVALISTLGGVGLGFLGLAFVFQIMEAPLAGIPIFFLSLTLLLRPYNLPIWLPTTGIILAAGTALAWLTGAAPVTTLGLAPLALPGPFLPILDLSFIADAWVGAELATMLSVVLPISLLAVIASLQNIESAAAAGDPFPERPCLLVNGLGSLAASLFGSPFPTSIYIGHPAWKQIGARYHYSILNGIAVALLCLSGLLTTIVWLIPVEAGITIIFWIGLIIVAQSFETSSRRYFPAAIIGLMPGLAAWVLVLASSLVAGLSTGPGGQTGFHAEFLSQQSRSGNFIAGGIALQQGFLLTAMLWSTMTVFILDREFLRAAVAALIAAGLAGIGLMHGYRLVDGGIVVDIPILRELGDPRIGSWWAAPAEVGGYLIAAAIFLAVHWILKLKPTILESR